LSRARQRVIEPGIFESLARLPGWVMNRTGSILVILL
jgi:hypothetical protein